MRLDRRTLLKTAPAGALGLYGRRARAATTVRIGVLGDESGLYQDISGPLAVACVKLAAAEAMAASPGLSVEVVVGDHQNKADIGAGIARDWFDRGGVDMIVDVPNSSVALAIAALCREKDKVAVISPAASADLTGKLCAPTTVHWTSDTWMLAHSTGGAMVRAGGDSWFFLSADYAFGQALERDTTAFVTQAGGHVVGSVKHPVGTSDFSSFLVQAQASRAKVIGLCNSGGDTIGAIKQAAEFEIGRGGQKLAGLLVFISDVHALGLEQAAGLVLTESFYWDLDDRTRAFSERVRKTGTDRRPNMAQAGCYAGTLHYLKAVAALGGKPGGAASVARMKAMPTEDDAFGPGSIRPDGRALHPVHLFEVKTKAESRGPWDYYKTLATTPPEQAWRPLAEGGCALVGI